MLVEKAGLKGMKVSKMEIQISSEFKLNEGIMLSLKFALLFWTRNKLFMNQSGLTISRQAQATLLFLLFQNDAHVVNLYQISMQEIKIVRVRKST